VIQPLKETVDPVSVGLQGPQAPTAVAAIEILLHSDLSRIGESCRLGPASDDAARFPTMVGREAPHFQPALGGEGRALLDPCISRVQAIVQWAPARGRFGVNMPAGARRPVRLFTLQGEAIEAGEVEPGTLLAIGDRILLQLRVQPGVASDPLGMLGNSGAMAALRFRIQSVASFNDSVLIQGETGTGKELVAQAIHLASARRDRPFVALNCAALPEALIESELFGYAKGAFSGANQSKPGLFAAAAGGTLFLDEIGEMPLALQAKLLRVLEVKRMRPVGQQHEEPVDVRIVAATHRDLRKSVREEKFREDLYGRIESPRIEVPPLRERREDIPLLFVLFLRRRAHEYAQQQGRTWETSPFAGFWREATAYPPPVPLPYMMRLIGHDWPRNIRELDKFAAEVAASLVQGAGLPPPPGGPSSLRERQPTHPPASDAVPPPTPPVPPLPDGDTRAHQRPDRAEIERVLGEQNFNQTEAARALGVSYATLDRWLRELGIVRPKDLSREEILAAWQQAAGDTTEMARLLRVSLRGLKGRLKELGLDSQGYSDR
jgi:DNA-binding NtrC family response regulator